MEYIRNNKKEISLVLLISALALWFRIICLKNAGDLWIDEIYSYYFAAKDSVLNVIKSLNIEDLHTPLYFILLHLWIKFWGLFGLGENDTTMRLLGFIPSFLIVPISFYIGKNLFNKAAGYFAALMLAFSPFLIYYTTELRFYGMMCFFALLSSFLFVKYLQNKDKKCEVALITFNLLLLYTFNISFVFVFFQFLAGLFFNENKREIIKIYLLTSLFYLPGFIMTAHGMFSYKNAICSFSRDIFIYKPEFFSIFLQTYFSGNFFYATNNNYDYSALIFKNVKNIYLILCPIIFCSAGFIRGLVSKNKTLYLFLLPGVLFLGFEFILAHFGMMSLTVRYTLISYPMVVLACAYGFSILKFGRLKYLTEILFVLFLISIHNFIFAYQSPIEKDVEFGTPLKATLDKLDIIKKDDYVLIPVMGKLYRRYTPKEANYLDFEITDMLLNDVRKYYPIAFDDETIAKLDRKNAREILYDYATGEKSSKQLEKYLTGHFENFKPGTKFIVLVNNMNTIKSMSEFYTYTSDKKRELYYKNSLYYILMTRMVFDILDISNKNLVLKQKFVINDSKYSDNNTGVFVFVK